MACCILMAGLLGLAVAVKGLLMRAAAPAGSAQAWRLRPEEEVGQ